MLNQNIRTPLSGIRTRIAPSPTGNLHLGTARAALFNYLFARHNNGKFILRIEDTDLERSDPKFEEDILEGLKWLGIEWDEGPAINSKFEIRNSKQIPNSKFHINPIQPSLALREREGKLQRYIGEYGPYRQSERIVTYTKYIKKLLNENKAYYCFCTEEELKKERELQKTMGQPLKYSGKCANLSAQEVEKLKSQGRKSVIRFRILKNRKVKFKDLIRGELEFDSNLIGDIVIAKDLNTPLYNFAVVVDDYLMQISHIIRGEDHISNTPKQILMQEALGFPTPHFAHLPLILGSDHAKLSKRHGATSVTEYKKQGYLPQAMLNFMAFLGWNPKTKKEVFSKEELIAEFDLKGVGKSGAIFNIERLDWINGFYIRQISLDKLTELCLPYLVEAEYIQKIPNSKFQITSKSQILNSKIFYKIIETDRIVSFNELEKVIALEQERIKKLSEIPRVLDFYFKKNIEYETDLLVWKKTGRNKIRRNLEILQKFLKNLPEKEFERKNLETKIKDLIAKEKMGVGEALWPVRVALSGKQGSPGPFEIIEVLGKERTLVRIREAILKL